MKVRRAPKPAPGPLTQRVGALRTLRARANESALIHREHGAPGEWTAVANGITYTLSLPQGIENQMVMANGSLMRVLRVPAVACNPPSPLAVTPPHDFINPPLMVEDGTVREVPDPGHPENTTLIANNKEDPQAALKVIVTQAVLGNNAVVTT